MSIIMLSETRAIDKICRENGFKLIHSCYVSLGPFNKVPMFYYNNKKNYMWFQLIHDNYVDLNNYKSTYPSHSRWQLFTKEQINYISEKYELDFRL